MSYEIVNMEEFSGNQATVYSIIPEGEQETLFDKFVKEYKHDFKDEIKDIVKRLYIIGHTTGARNSFFKEHEGKPADFVCALFDTSEKKLRLYCIRIGMDVVILGGGGEKSKEIRAWQEDEKLTKAANQMIEYAEDFWKRMKEKDIYWYADGRELEGNL